jgi:hypothetical protein
MKLLYPVLFAAYVLAEGEDCFDECEDGDMACLMACDARSGGKKFSHIVRMVNANVNTAFSYSEMVKRISNYGCHCSREVVDQQLDMVKPLIKLTKPADPFNSAINALISILITPAMLISDDIDMISMPVQAQLTAPETLVVNSHNVYVTLSLLTISVPSGKILTTTNSTGSLKETEKSEPRKVFPSWTQLQHASNPVE